MFGSQVSEASEWRGALAARHGLLCWTFYFLAFMASSAREGFAPSSMPISMYRFWGTLDKRFTDYMHCDRAQTGKMLTSLALVLVVAYQGGIQPHHHQHASHRCLTVLNSSFLTSGGLVARQVNLQAGWSPAWFPRELL